MSHFSPAERARIMSEAREHIATAKRENARRFSPSERARIMSEARQNVRAAKSRRRDAPNIVYKTGVSIDSCRRCGR